MNEDMLKMIGIIVVIGFIIYLAAKSLQLHNRMVEGLTNPTDLSVANGEAGSSANFAAAIKAQVIKMQDKLLISKYRTDYENAIQNMEEYIDLLMLQSLLNMDTSSDSVKTNIDAITNLNSLQSVKAALNTIGSFVDSK